MAEKTITEEVSLDAKAVEQIVEKTSEAVMPAIEDKLKENVDEAVKAAIKSDIEEATKAASEKVLEEYLAKTEEIERKAVEKANKTAASESLIAKGIENEDFSEEQTKLSPAMRFFMAAKALDPEAGDRKLLRQLNKLALASQLEKRAEILKEKGFEAVQKTGYANEATQADGSVLIPDAEFVTTVFDNLPTYGVAFQFADVRQTDRTSVRVLSLDTGLTFYSTAEAGVKTGAKLAFAKNEVSLQKFAVIVPATDELSEDSAVDYWNLVTRELTRGYAKKADELVFTDPATGVNGSSASTQTGGLTNLTGVLTQSVGANDGVITWSDIFSAEAKPEDDLDTSNYRWFMRKQTWLTLVQQRADAATAGDAAGQYLIGSLNLGTGWKADLSNPSTPWGTEVVFTRVLPTVATVSTNDGFAVYGDLSNTMLYNKNGMALKMLTEATVVDSEGSNLNLATQDASAMRAVIRMLHICPKANRPKFVILGSGTVS